jgi:hypothetical protein
VGQLTYCAGLTEYDLLMLLGYQSMVSSTSTARVQAYRHRRKSGIWIVRIRFDELEVESLINKGYLEESKRSDNEALRAAAQMLLSDALCGEIYV